MTLIAGLIGCEHVKRVTEILGTYLTDEEIEEMVDDADKDFDGFVRVNYNNILKDLWLNLNQIYEIWIII